MKRPNESDYTSHVAYARALEEYCDMLEQPSQEPDIYPEEARDMGLEAVAYYTTPPAAQPAQEPVIGTKTWFEDGKIVTQNLYHSDIYTTRNTQEEHMTHTINSTGTAAVATDYYWIPIDANTPRGVKLQLLGNGGVAAYGNYQGAPFWSHWAPLPKRRD
jgi:hypothetical protein